MTRNPQETAQLDRIETGVNAVLARIEDHEARIRGLEKWRNRISGSLAGVAALLTGFLAYARDWILPHHR